MADRTITFAILADSKQAEAAMGRVSTKTDGMGESFKNAAALAGAYIAGKALQAVKDFVGDSIRAYSDLEQSVGGTEAVFGDSSAAIDKFAKGSADAIGLSEAQFRTATTSIGGQLKRMTGDVNLAATESVNLTNVAADLAATYGGTTAEAVQALGAAFRGEADPAERFNLNLKQGAVNAKAVEMGLASTTTQVDENAKAQATLALIMEQSADAQGQFGREAETAAGRQQRMNAEMENAKAMAGEALMPFERLRTSLGLLAAETLGVLATQFSVLFGGMNEVDGAIQQFEIHMGQSADTAEAALTIMREYGASASDLIPRLGLTTEELERLRDADEEVLIGLGFTTEQIKDLQVAVGTGLSPTINAATGFITTGFVPGQEAAADATGDTTDAIDDQIDAIKRLTDPIFAATSAARDLRTAQQEYNDALVKHGPASDEAIEAAERVISAQGDLDAALKRIVDEGGPNWRAEFRRVAAQSGIAEESIDGMIAAVERADGMSATVDVRAVVRAPNFRYVQDPETGTARPRFTGISEFAKGGVVKARPGGLIGQVGEAGRDEAVAPIDTLMGMIKEAVAESGGGGGSGGGTVINLTVNAGMGTDGYQVGKQIVEILQQYSRIGGPLRLDVRTE